MDGTAEKFDRTLESGDSTRNEFFNRPVTYATNIPQLPSILADGSWTRGSTSDPIWDSNYIPSIFVTADESEMENLIENVAKNTYNAKVTFIGPDNVTTIEVRPYQMYLFVCKNTYLFIPLNQNCQLGLHRPGRKNNDAKQSWVWALPKGQFFADRNWFKIRHQEEDPTQLREKLYADIARKMGTYANEANLVRFFVNKEGMGTFNMLDDVIMYSYINAMFYNGQTPEKFGGLFDGGSGASFNSKDGFDSFTPNVESPLHQSDIAPFSNAFGSVDFKDDAQVKAIAEYFDYDQFLRFMVMEFLTGDWDGYWMEQTNIGAYIDVNENNKMYYLGQDYDATFGVNLAYDADFVDTPFTDYSEKFPNGYLINKLLQNPTVKTTFTNYLAETVNQIFNNATLGPYVTARHDFIYPDLEWDRSIKQRSPGNIFGWTAEQTYLNLFEPVSAPGEKPGGAGFGLLEWVARKEAAVRKSLKLTDKNSTATVPEDNSSSGDVEENSNVSAAGIKPVSAAEKVDTSDARKTIPQVLSAMAVVGAVAALL